MPDEKRNRPTWVQHSGVGIEFSAAVGGFALMGIWIDRRWDTGPWGLLICVALGLTGATYNLIRASMKAFRSDTSRDRQKDGDAKDGTAFAKFYNDIPGRGSSMLQGFAIDGCLWLLADL